MKMILVVVILLTPLFSVALYAQQRKTQQQTAPRIMRFDELVDYINSDKIRPGERLVLSGAPLIKKVIGSISEGKGFYRFEYPVIDGKVTTDQDTGGLFLTSEALAKSLRPHLKSNAVTLRVTCTMIEFYGDYDYHLPFVTKIEGIDTNGAIIWTATGVEPPRFRFRTGDKLRD